MPPQSLHVCFSNRPFGVKHFQTIHHCGVECRSRARASLRNRHQGPSIMGFEDEAEQSLGRPCRLSDGRSKRTYELTSSIVPQGTSYALQSCTLVASVLSEFFNASGRKAASAFKACSECNRSRPGRNGAG